MLEEVLSNAAEVMLNKEKRKAAMIWILSVNSLVFCSVIPLMTLLIGIGGMIAVLLGYDKNSGIIYKISAVFYAACIFLSARNLCLLYY